MSFVQILLFFVTFSLVLRYYLFPLLFARLTQFRVSSFSILAARGLEYRSKAQRNAVVPTLRIEKIGWIWGGLKSDEVGLVILKLESVSFRVKKTSKDQTASITSSSTKISAWKGRITSSILHLFIHHYPSIARITSIQISDIRIIFDDLEGLELGVKNLHLGVKVNFEGKVEPAEPAPKATAPIEEYRRYNPLASPCDEFSPPSSPPQSPLAQFRSFTFTGTPDPMHEVECNDATIKRMSRMAHARRRASHFQSKMTSTAGQVWSRAIARAHGSVSFALSIDDVGLVLPHGASQEAEEKGLSHRDSTQSLSPETALRPRSFASVGSFHSILRPQFARNTTSIPTEGYERLVSLQGQSKAVLALGFGPKKGLLGEDTLRTDIAFGKLSTTLESVDKLQDLLKRNKEKLALKKEEEPAQRGRWTPRSMPRIILRAFESVAVSLNQFTLIHHLPSSDSSPVSANSSFTDITDLQTPDDAFVVSLDVTQIYCKLDAADSTTDQRARNAFGTNTSPESKVRGFAIAFGWNSIGLQCLAPGEKKDEMTQLVQMRSAEFEGLSTWRPSGWSREELLFASDPNLALVVGKGSVDSIDVAGDVQLLDELAQSWKRNRPSKPRRVSTNPRGPFTIPPRIRLVLDVGHAMVTLADRVSENKTTLTLASDGLHLGCFTSFTDVVARRRDRAVNRSAFKREEELRQRRDEADGVDYAQPPQMLKPELRRLFSAAGALQDDYSLVMAADATMVLEPMSLHMSLAGPTLRDQKTYHLASVGRAHGTVTGDIQGRHDMRNGVEIATLDPESTSCLFDLGIDSGVKLNMWNMPVIDALAAMARAHRPPADVEKPPRESVLCRLPSGISARISLGVVSVFIGHQDPNPHCDVKLSRGLWVQTTFLWEYAYYKRRSQSLRHQHTQTALTRTKLRLPEDITTQALAFENSLSAQDGRAALISFTLTETSVKPIYDGQAFSDTGGTSLSHAPVKKPRDRASDEAYVGWEFRRARDDSIPSDPSFGTNQAESFEASGTDQASRPLVRIKRIGVNWGVVRMSGDSPVVHKATSKVDNVELVCDLSHIYCVLLVAMAVRKITRAVEKTAPRQKAKPDVRIEVVCPSIKAHFAFPLKEQLYIYMDNVAVSKPLRSGLKATAKKVLAFVPSPREVGSWEELARIKAVDLRTAAPGQPKLFAFNAEAFRVRIPVTYKMSKLILNINVTIKALKLLVSDLDRGRFETVKKPGAEHPKKLPSILINIENMSFEAKDDPIETNLNIIWRAGLAEQENRNELEDTFEAKINLIEETTRMNGDHDVDPQAIGKLTSNVSTTYEDARNRLDWFHARRWVRRTRLAKQEQRRREQTASKHLEDAGLSNVSLPITIVSQVHTAPLFRLSLNGASISVSDLGWSRDEIIKYMGDASSPFDEGQEFSLMVPMKLSWTMKGGLATLRDYPLPLVRIPTVPGGETPAWHVETPFIIAEELQGDDSLMMIPVEVIPKGCGALKAASFTVQIAKTIMPVKTYSRPVVNISTPRTTEFTWGNSYQPAIQDFMKVVETLSHPPRDTSPRVGFWDKFKLVLHWKVTLNFVGNVHLHLKGSTDPYAVVGHGAGFALSWKGGTKFEIAQPNDQHETVQITSQELLVAIPDLTALHDNAAMGNERSVPPQVSVEDGQLPSEQAMIERRYTKPCARFLNGVRVGFGFVFERTCRPWDCQENCGHIGEARGPKGPILNLFRRKCRIFEFKRHQEVILKSPDALKREKARLHRMTTTLEPKEDLKDKDEQRSKDNPKTEEEQRIVDERKIKDAQEEYDVDSYEGFRSDFIHFSVSVVAPLSPSKGRLKDDAENQNSLHMSPKAFAHFFAWWKTFSGIHLPIRQGKLFPNAPPPSKKFGKSIGTIKYRADLAPVYLSHMYVQTSKEMWQNGKSQSLGVKARIDQFKADAHQRMQNQKVHNETLGTDTTTPHKVFYAVDLLLSGIEVKGVCANFTETTKVESNGTPQLARIDDLPQEKRDWYNFFDFIDADKKPFDRNPELEIIDVMDCPQVFYSKRVKARQIPTNDADEKPLGDEDEAETSKFGHELSHICYLGAAGGVAETQMRITRERIAELEERQNAHRDDQYFDQKQVASRLRTLRKHLSDLVIQEHRHIDDDTFESNDPRRPAMDKQGEQAFVHTFHAHCPRVFYNNLTRNIVFKYWFSSRDRKKEEYMTSHASLRGVRDGIQRRLQRQSNGFNQDDIPDESFPLRENAATELLRGLQAMLGDKLASKLFQLPQESSEHEDPRPHVGLPEGCTVKPNMFFLVLKPQIALRSGVAENSVILLAVEEISYKMYSILDESARDDVTKDVMSRQYVSMKGLQAFYPTSEALQREQDASPGHRGLDFIPLEIFLDVRSEATDYDRIVLKADAEISIDRFNHLRMPRGLEWPDAKDERGNEIRHLRLHQDLVTVVLPRLQVSATSKHYNALYNVVTDLLIYQDPGHRERSERIDNFTFAFDRKDRDPQRLLMDLHNLQHSIRQLGAIKRGYEANVDLLTEEGRAQLFGIRTDQQESLEQLFTVFEAISVNKARDDARAALKSTARFDVRVGGIAWHMLRDDLAPLLKLDIEGTFFSSISNKDGSRDNAVTFGDLSALNSDSDAWYPEVLVRNESGHKRKAKETFASACWSILAPVGGIDIVRHFAFYIHPVLFRLEERVGHQVMDYIFSDRVERRKRKVEKGDKPKTAHKELGMSQAEGNRSSTLLRSSSGIDMPQLSRSKSQVSVATMSTNNTGLIEEMGNKPDDKFTMVPTKDASEMRRRASAVKTFVGIVFGATSLVLSYKSDESRKKHGSWSYSVPDCVDFKLKTPQMTYSNKVWGYEDLFEHVKRDIKAYAWSQTGDLLGQLFKKTSMFRSKKGLRHLAMSNTDVVPNSPSNLRFAVQPPTPMEEEASNSIALARALTREREISPSSPLSRTKSRSTVLSDDTPQVLGVPLHNEASLTEEEEEPHDEEGRGIMGKTVKGILGKIKKHTSKFDLPNSHSSDESVRGSPVEKNRSRSSFANRSASPPPYLTG